MDIKEYFKKNSAAINKALDRYLPKPGEYPSVIHKAMRYSVLSDGKRIRPILVLASCKACGGNMDDALACGCAVEMIHAYSLIHDDLPSMDNDALRRGKPTCHIAFGEANAILAGDALLPLAFNIIARDVDPAVSVSVIKELSYAIGTKGIVGGQVVDMEFKNREKDSKVLDYINTLKTAKLFEASTKIGAIISGCEKNKIDAMAKYGSLIGLAFQVTDDIIDSDGYAKKFGIDKACLYAEYLTEKAKDELKAFGSAGKYLTAIADYIFTRTTKR